jgi:small subunit ribosomal protein S16
MLAIKLQRTGKKHQPSYRLVVAERRSKMAAPPVEDLGSYSTTTKKAQLKGERVSYWLGIGAQPTVTVHNLLVKEGVLKAPKVKLIFKVPEKPTEAMADKPEKAAAPAEPTAAPAAEKPTEVAAETKAE